MSAPELPSRGDAREALTAFESVRARRAALDAEEILTLAGAKALVEGAHGPVARSSAADIAYRSLVADLAAATRVSERTVRQWVDDAADLVDRFGEALVALGRARISRAHVQVIYEHGAGIVDDDARDAYTRRMVELAEELTPARLRQVAKIAADRARPTTIDERHRSARARRRIAVFDIADGMSELTMVLPSVLAHAIYERTTHDARTIIRDRSRSGDADDPGDDADVAADGRTIDEIRADVASDLLLTGTATTCTTGDGIDAITATVQITVPVLALADASNEPALLAGTGPVDRATARRLVGNARGWERVMTSPVDGAVLAVDRYRPDKRLVRFLRARDEHCRFPGCRQPVWRCDIDHSTDHAHGGSTAACNLAHLCRHHHMLKHASPWTVRQLPGGVLEWTSPTGRVYIDTPEPVVRFVPDAGPPPPF